MIEYPARGIAHQGGGTERVESLAGGNGSFDSNTLHAGWQRIDNDLVLMLQGKAGILYKINVVYVPDSGCTVVPLQTDVLDIGTAKHSPTVRCNKRGKVVLGKQLVCSALVDIAPEAYQFVGPLETNDITAFQEGVLGQITLFQGSVQVIGFGLSINGGDFHFSGGCIGTGALNHLRQPGKPPCRYYPGSHHLAYHRDGERTGTGEYNLRI